MAQARRTGRTRITAGAGVMALVAVLFTPSGAQAAAGTTARVSVASDGAQSNGPSQEMDVSADGRYVAFSSSATNLVPGDTNGVRDVFVHDRQSGATTRMSVSSTGLQGQAESFDPAISGDGRYVAFTSGAANLVVGDANTSTDVFVHDRQSGVTTLASRASDGTQGAGNSSRPDISADGRYVAFASGAANLVTPDTNLTLDVFVHDLQTGATSRVSVSSGRPPLGGVQGNSLSDVPSISADGSHVAFHSDANNLVPGDTTSTDVFVHDRASSTTTRVSVTSDGSQADNQSLTPSISADDNTVSFEANSTNLVPGDTNGDTDVFVHDRLTGATSRVNVSSTGAQSNDSGHGSSLSADGRYVSFRSQASNLVGGDTNNSTDIFVHDRQTGFTAQASVAPGGAQSNSGSSGAAMSDDGGHVAFSSAASNLVANDTNNTSDIFVRDDEDLVGPPDPPVVSVGDASVVEKDSGSRPATFTVSLSVASPSTVTVAWTTADGTATAPGDYTAGTGTVTFAPGTVTRTIDVPVHGDGDLEGHEAFSVVLSDPGGATIGRATGVGTIVDDDPTASVGDATVYEGDEGTRAAVFTVTLSKPAASAVTVGYATSDNTATAGQDYTAKSGSLTFSPGVTSLPVKVPVAGDLIDESSGQSFRLSLTAVNGAVMGDATGTGFVTDDDPDSRSGIRMAIGDVIIHEGDAGTRTALLNVSMSKPWTSTVTVDFATVKGSATKPNDFVGKSGKLSFAPGTTTLNVKVAINPDTVVEGNESLTVVLSGLTGGGTFIGDESGTLTILDND